LFIFSHHQYRDNFVIANIISINESLNHSHGGFNMESKTLKGLVAASLMTLGMLNAAHAGVACPEASEVKGAVKALNAVIRMNEKTYFVLSAQPAINASDLGWIVAAQASAAGFDAAHSAGSTSVKNVISAMTPEAIEQGGAYLCAYLTSSGGMPVMALAPQQQGFIFNPGMLNLDAIKAKK
jgi:hypothetical protein